MWENDAERFWAKVDIKESDECWNWTAGKHPRGYGQFRLAGRHVQAHRYALLGDACHTEPLLALHHCDNTSCCNPKHLYLGTHGDNLVDRTNRNPNNVGGGNGGKRLCEDEVQLGRELISSGASIKHIAKTLDTSIHAIYRLRKGTYHGVGII